MEKIIFLKTFDTFNKKGEKICIKKGTELKKDTFLYARLNDLLYNESGPWITIKK